MVRKLLGIALAGTVVIAVSPAFAAQMMDVPVVGQVDIDPLNVMSPAPAAAPAAAPMKKMHHHKMHHHKMMHKKMMKKKM